MLLHGPALLQKLIVCEILVFHKVDVEDSDLTGYYAE
jgi:hypothetical protein